jgi:YD repeat-containing protein
MKNILGTTEELELFNKAGIKVYEFTHNSNRYSYEITRDSDGNQLTYKDSNGFSHEYTRDLNGNELTYKNSNGFSHEYTRDSNNNTLTFKNSNGYSYEYTYDSNGNELTFKNSKGVTRGFDIPEYTMEELVEKLGNFKIKK